MLNIKNTTDGYFKNVEIKGNTIQDAENLADIRSVGDKLENQELYKIDVVSSGKNLFNLNKVVDLNNDIQFKDDIITLDSKIRDITNITKFKPNIEYTLTYNRKVISGNGVIGFGVYYTDGSTEYLIGSSTLNFLNFTFGKNKTISRFELSYSDSCTCELSNIQLEEGTVATPYEPYQGDKLTILSPVQLEKVGDVRDRIICKDGVWGVEKNIKTYVVSQDTVITHHGNHANGTASYRIENVLEQPNLTVITSKFNQISFSALFSVGDIGHASHESATHLYVRLEGDTTLDIAKQQLQGMLIKYMTLTPQFIPLPHDQQVKLRTFAGQTNIHFETEIEGTIKAQVPKSLGATVNTHTEQIDILNKKVFKIEEIDQVQQDMMILESDLRILDIELALMEHMPITLNIGENTMLRSVTYFNFLKNHIINETYSKDYLENVMKKYLATGRINQDEYNELYKLLYPPVYDIELPIEY